MNAVITGSTKGIGRAIVELLADKGMNLAICARTSSDVTALLDDLNNRFPKQSFIGSAVDMSKKEEVIHFAESIQTQMETVDVLINNAGVFLPGSILEEPDGALEQMVDTNLYSAYYLTRKLTPAMISQGHGHIFNMCSIASVVAYPNGGSYSISKFAMLGFSKVLREELKETGVKVTSILPGATWSASWAGVDLPESRLMQAEDVASVVWNALQMSPSAVMEEIIIRPQLGDL